jgi:hypothetical protein
MSPLCIRTPMKGPAHALNGWLSHDLHLVSITRALILVQK